MPYGKPKHSYSRVHTRFPRIRVGCPSLRCVALVCPSTRAYVIACLCVHAATDTRAHSINSIGYVNTQANMAHIDIGLPKCIAIARIPSPSQHRCIYTRPNSMLFGIRHIAFGACFRLCYAVLLDIMQYAVRQYKCAHDSGSAPNNNHLARTTR